MKTYFFKTLILFVLIFTINKFVKAQPTQTPLNLTVTQECQNIIIKVSYPYSIPSSYRLEVYLDLTGSNAGVVRSSVMIGNLTSNTSQITYIYPVTQYFFDSYCAKVRAKFFNTQYTGFNWGVFSTTKCAQIEICNSSFAPSYPQATTSNIECKSFKVTWTNDCEPDKVAIYLRNSTGTIISTVEVLKGINSYTFTNLSVGATYYYNMRGYHACTNSSTTPTWTAYSPLKTVILLSTTTNAGPDKTITCGNGVYLQAIATSGARGSVVGSSPAGYTGSFYNQNQPNAYFYINNYGANSYTLKWENDCGSDLMIVYTSFVCGTDLTDSRDSKVYPTVSINGKCWFKKNLDYGTQIPWGGSRLYKNPTSTTDDASWPASSSNIVKYCFKNSSVNCTTHGALYLGDVAALSGLCPPCWHVASDNEWTQLANYAASINNNVAATNLKGSTLGFNAVLSGVASSSSWYDGWLLTGFSGYAIYMYTDNNFRGLLGTYLFLGGSGPLNGMYDGEPTGKVAQFWTSTSGITFDNVSGEFPTRYSGTRGGGAWARRFEIGPVQGSPPGDKLFKQVFPRRDIALHVRCVKD